MKHLPVVALVVMASITAGCTDNKTPIPKRPPRPSVSSSSAAGSSSTQHVASAGLSIDVPADWPVNLVSKQQCFGRTAPSVLVGSFSDVRDCFVQTSAAGPAVIFASGGPPFPPIPTTAPAVRTVNGVRMLVSTAATGMGGETAVLALFPGRDAWIEVDVKGGATRARAEADRILSTVKAVSAVPVDRTDSPPESFLGVWHVHGAQMTITPTTGVIRSNCSPPCVETTVVSLSRSKDGTRLTAVIASVTYTNETTGRPIPNPFPHDSEAVGDSSYFEFVAPHLMKETIVRSSLPPDEVGYGNPYWCGEHLAPELSWACGA